ncbi:hypothetical protein NPIL_318711 [Nephila pilipes]|uniref:Uncharacterized protein n=1 Tax=Nephila pilipes TaxID=299642 RepID=A0A8X6TK21_NEPPI|nr:hypothetical protein NPIL_318711 [Nephila pilipes]
MEGFHVLSGDTGVQFGGSIPFLRDFAVFQHGKTSKSTELSRHPISGAFLRGLWVDASNFAFLQRNIAYISHKIICARPTCYI